MIVPCRNPFADGLIVAGLREAPEQELLSVIPRKLFEFAKRARNRLDGLGNIAFIQTLLKRRVLVRHARMLAGKLQSRLVVAWWK